MTVYVMRGRTLVTKAEAERSAHNPNRSAFPSPLLSRIEPFESPVTGKEITSWRDRDRDMAAVGAVDLRDMPRSDDMKRGRRAQAKERADGRRTDQPAADPGVKWGSLADPS